MKYLILIISVCLVNIVYSQELELININKTNKISLGEGVELELRMKLDEFDFNKSELEIMSQKELVNKIVVIHKEIGVHKIGPFSVGKFVSNTLQIEVVPLKMKGDTYLEAMDSCQVNQEIKLTLVNKSKEDNYSIKDFKLKESSKYDIKSHSYSVTVSKKDGETIKKESLLITIIPKQIGTLKISSSSFDVGNIDGFRFDEKIITVE